MASDCVMDVTNKIKQILSSHTALGWAVALVILLRLVFTGIMGMMPQDAYYSYYAANPDWSYFDHPPMIAYLLWFFHSVLGKTVLSVKLANILTTTLFLIFYYYLSCRFLPRGRAIIATFVLGTTVMASILSLVSTPDVPLVLFWTLSLMVIDKAINKPTVANWALVGLAIGLAFDSKYSAVLLIGGTFLFMLCSNYHRKHLYSLKTYAVVITFAVAIGPVIFWNATHDWGSFAFQSTTRMSSVAGFNIKPQLTIGLIATQLFILLPILFWIIGKSHLKWIIKAYRRKSFPNNDILFLLCFSLPGLVLFFTISPLYWIKLNWLMPSYITASILAIKYFNKKHIRWHAYLVILFHLLLAIEILLYPIPIKSDDTWYGWPDLAQEVENIQQEEQAEFIFSADGYKTSAILDFYLSEKIYGQNILGRHALQFSIVHPDVSILQGKSAIFLDSESHFTDGLKRGSIREDLEVHFDLIEELDPILIYRKDRLVRKFLVYYCQGYRPPKG